MENLDVHPRIVASLKKVHINKFEQILSLSNPELERRAKLSTSDVNSLKKAVAELVHKPPVVTALDLRNNTAPKELCTQKLTTGCQVLDKFLSGGILCRGITEITGRSASGKTQLCLQLALTAQLPLQQGGLNGGTVYICTEDAFPNKRLYQMIQHFKQRTSSVTNSPTQLGDSIFIEHVADLEGLHMCIRSKLPLLLGRGQVKLVIIDSVAALFRCEFESGQMVQRARSIGTLAAQLHKLTNQFNIPVVCVNQVSDSFKTGDAGKVVPALGLTWSNYVTMRLMLSREPGVFMLTGGDGKSPTQVVLRNIEILFSPHLPNITCQYIVDQEGVKGIG